MLNINEFGLVVMTRKRVRQSLERMLSIACPYCNGKASVESPETVACEVFRELERIAAEGVKGGLRVVLQPQVSEYMEAEMAEHLDNLRKSWDIEISLFADESFHHEQFDIIEE